MQLDLLLRSFKHFVQDADSYHIDVLYTYSSEFFELGYNKLMNRNFINVGYIKENDFKADLLNLINEEKPATVFFVDDDVFKNPIDFYDDQMTLLWEDGNILCRSLRLHRNLKYCYPARVPMIPPKFLPNNVFFWRGLAGDYGYPASLDGHIFITREILPFLKEFSYANPNTLESAMMGMRMDKPKMVCYDESIIMNIPLNKVQTVNNNIHGNMPTEHLNKLYLAGKVINLIPIMGFRNSSCHQEIDITFV